MIQLIFVLWTSYFFPQQPPQVLIEFENIDNQVKVLLDGQEVFDFNRVKEKADQATCDLTSLLKADSESFTVQLFNGDGNPYDKRWEIKYSVLLNGDEVDYMWEQREENKLGLVFEKEYFIDDL